MTDFLQNAKVTNDGATILKSISLDNAAAKILVNISKVQDDEVGDGTTSVCVLASELLKEAEKLVNMKIHPQTIIEGFRIASWEALKALEESAVDHGWVFAFRFPRVGCIRGKRLSGMAYVVVISASPEAFREDLLNIARTTLSSKVLSADKDYFANLAVTAVLRLKVHTYALGPERSSLSGSDRNLHAGLHGSGQYSDHQKGRRQAYGLVFG